jgi:hypothetical protein
VHEGDTFPDEISQLQSISRASKYHRGSLSSSHNLVVNLKTGDKLVTGYRGNSANQLSIFLAMRLFWQKIIMTSTEFEDPTTSFS